MGDNRMKFVLVLISFVFLVLVSSHEIQSLKASEIEDASVNVQVADSEVLRLGREAGKPDKKKSNKSEGKRAKKPRKKKNGKKTNKQEKSNKNKIGNRKNKQVKNKKISKQTSKSADRKRKKA